MLCTRGLGPRVQQLGAERPHPPSSSLLCGPLPPGAGASGSHQPAPHTGPEPAPACFLLPRGGDTPGRQQWWAVFIPFVSH